MNIASCNYEGTYVDHQGRRGWSFVAVNRFAAALRHYPLFSRLALLLVAVCWLPGTCDAAWTIVPRGSVTLDTSSVTGVAEMSGITYLGSSGGLHEFAAVQDSGGQVVRFDVAFATDGTIQSAVASASVSLSMNRDFEGISYTNPERNSVFVSEENTPTIREFSLADGTQLQSVSLPEVYNQQRGNRGLESLTSSYGGTQMWTANEEALAVDGPLATSSLGTTVRLQQFEIEGHTLSASRQFAYEVDPIHLTTNPDRSGLADLVLMPDGALLALERSAASFIPPFESRLYKVDFTGATDSSNSTFDAGLNGQAFTPVGKSLLWSGQVGGGFGENLEGLSLGPKLADGSWVLLGVVDSGDQLSSNTVVAFQAIPSDCDLAGDYNCSGVVDAQDYQTWRDTFGSSDALFADGNGDGRVTLADYAVWRNNLGASVALTASVSVPEPTTNDVIVPLLATVGFCLRRRRSDSYKVASSGSNNSSHSNNSCGSMAPHGRFSTPKCASSGC